MAMVALSHRKSARRPERIWSAVRLRSFEAPIAAKLSTSVRILAGARIAPRCAAEFNEEGSRSWPRRHQSNKAGGRIQHSGRRSRRRRPLPGRKPPREQSECRASRRTRGRRGCLDQERPRGVEAVPLDENDAQARHRLTAPADRRPRAVRAELDFDLEPEELVRSKKTTRGRSPRESPGW